MFGRGGDARRHLADIAVRPAVSCVVQVMEFADAGEAALEHLHVGKRRDRLDVIGRKLRQEPVHRLAPGPKGVVDRSATLGETSERALERVAMQVRQPRQGNAADLFPDIAGSPSRDLDDHAILDPHVDIARPTAGQKCIIERERAAHRRVRSEQ